MLLVHYAVRHLMSRVAADHDTDPDRVSFIRSLRREEKVMSEGRLPTSTFSVVGGM